MISPLDAIHRSHLATLADITAAEGAPAVMLPLHYGDPDAEVQAAQAGAGLVDLSHLPTLRLESPDAKRWSNGMFTNNIRRLQPGQGNRSAMCDDRGRVQGLLDLYCLRDDLFQVVLDGVSLAAFQKRYQMFMVLDDIELEAEEGEPPWVLSLQGPRAAEILAAAGLPLPAPPDDSHAHTEADGVRVARKDRTGLGGFDLICADDDVACRVWAVLLTAGAAPLGHQALDALRVLGGRARWPQDGTDKSMVHELRLNEEVCNFNKGCYVGQEVINRIDVKGAIQKRLVGLRLPAPLPNGSPVFLEDKAVGTLTSQTTVAGATYGLGVLRKVAWEAGTTVEVRPEDGPTVAATVADLPFAAG